MGLSKPLKGKRIKTSASRIGKGEFHPKTLLCFSRRSEEYFEIINTLPCFVLKG